MFRSSVPARRNKPRFRRGTSAAAKTKTRENRNDQLEFQVIVICEKVARKNFPHREMRILKNVRPPRATEPDDRSGSPAEAGAGGRPGIRRGGQKKPGQP
jgi:hypothetical protein